MNQTKLIILIGLEIVKTGLACEGTEATPALTVKLTDCHSAKRELLFAVMTKIPLIDLFQQP